MFREFDYENKPVVDIVNEIISSIFILLSIIIKIYLKTNYILFFQRIGFQARQTNENNPRRAFARRRIFEWSLTKHETNYLENLVYCLKWALR